MKKWKRILGIWLIISGIIGVGSLSASEMIGGILLIIGGIALIKKNPKSAIPADNATYSSSSPSEKYALRPAICRR